MPPTSPGAAVSAGASLLTGQLLRYAWLTLIPSFGITLLYLNLHFLIRYFAQNKTFARFGTEWGVKGAGTASSGLEYGEIIVLILINALVLTALLGIAALALFMIWAYSNPCEFAAVVGSNIATTFGGIISTVCHVIPG